MNEIISLILLTGGIALILYGVQAANSVSSGFSRFFTNSPTEKSIWLLIMWHRAGRRWDGPANARVEAALVQRPGSPAKANQLPAQEK